MNITVRHTARLFYLVYAVFSSSWGGGVVRGRILPCHKHTALQYRSYCVLRSFTNLETSKTQLTVNTFMWMMLSKHAKSGVVFNLNFSQYKTTEWPFSTEDIPSNMADWLLMQLFLLAKGNLSNVLIRLEIVYWKTVWVLGIQGILQMYMSTCTAESNGYYLWGKSCLKLVIDDIFRSLLFLGSLYLFKESLHCKS